MQQQAQRSGDGGQDLQAADAATPDPDEPALPAHATTTLTPAPPRARARDVRALLRHVVGPETYVAARSLYRLTTVGELQAPLPYGFKLWAWRRGFQARHAALYDRAGIEAGHYLTDYAHLFRCDTLNPIPALFADKILLRRILADRGFVQPETLALVTRHGIVADPLGDARPATAAEFEAQLAADGGRFVVKPEDGRFGRRISLVEVRQGGRLVRRRGRDERPFDLKRDAPPVSLVERAVEQHEFWHGLSPFSVNTLRLLSMWTPGDPEPFIGCAVQRIGTAETLPTDNWAGGSVCAPIDLESGTLGVGRMAPAAAGRREGRTCSHHPDTGAPIAGLVIPDWHRIRETARAAARSIPYARYVGWDVAVDRQGTPVFIEGNHNSSVDLLQVHGGLLTNPAVRRFYEVCGVI